MLGSTPGLDGLQNQVRQGEPLSPIPLQPARSLEPPIRTKDFGDTSFGVVNFDVRVFYSGKLLRKLTSTSQLMNTKVRRPA
jgi:hypothetical protein